MDDYLVILKSEFAARDGSFLLQLRTQPEWDRAAFNRLSMAMYICCVKYAGTDVVERWLAEGFWYFHSFTRNWTTHPNFPRHHDEAYYAEAYAQLDDLAFGFFVGKSPYQDGYVFEPLK